MLRTIVSARILSFISKKELYIFKRVDQNGVYPTLRGQANKMKNTLEFKIINPFFVFMFPVKTATENVGHKGGRNVNIIIKTECKTHYLIVPGIRVIRFIQRYFDELVYY